MARDSSGHSGKKQWQEYGCICWRLSNIIFMTQNQVKEHERLSNIIFMTQNQVKEHERLFNIILMTQNQVKEHETIQYYTYDTKSSKGT
jgi:hypothetical protein